MAKANYIDRFVKNLEEKDKDYLVEKVLEPDDIIGHYQTAVEESEITMMSEWIEPAKELAEHAGKFWGLSTGYDNIDDLTKGLKGGDLIVLAGQASHGKTLFGNNIAYQMAREGIPILFITLEMTKEKVTSRFIKIAEDDKHDAHELPIYYQQVDTLSAKSVPKLIERAVEEAGVQAVIIDHLHFLADREARDMRMEIGIVTKNMKRAAIDLNIPIILLAQVRRLDDPKRKPNNNDLKESGYIEQDADTILMVWRDISIDSADTSAVELYCTKNRDNGFTQDRIKRFLQWGATLYQDNGTTVV